jgi:hypothetical protein
LLGYVVQEKQALGNNLRFLQCEEEDGEEEVEDKEKEEEV